MTNSENPRVLPEELLEHTPELINSYMEFANPLSDTPDEFLLMPFLSMSGALIGRKRYVIAGGSKILPIIWTVLFAGSSSMRKSTAISIAKKPFKDIQEMYKEEYHSELEEWKKKKKEAEENEEPFNIPEPTRKRLFAPDGFSDLTFWEALRDNRSLISVPSEFTELWVALNRPTANITELALKLFDGEGGQRVTKSGGDITLSEPVWCIAGATTIDKFRSTLSSIQRGSGFLQRLLPVCMEESPKKFRSILENPREDEGLRQDIVCRLLVINALDEMEMGISEDAREMYNEWSHQMHQESSELEESISDVGGYFSRLSIYGLKFAVIFQSFDEPDSDISAQNMYASIILCNWLKHHVLYMLEKNYIFDHAYADRIKIREIIGKQPDKRITRTKLMNNSNFTAKRLERALESDIASGLIGHDRIQTDGRARNEYFLETGDS